MKIGAFTQKIGSIFKKGDVAKKAAELANASTKTVANAVSKAPSYAAVKINGSVLYMPVSQISKYKGAEVLSKNVLNSVDDIFTEMGKYCNKL